MRTRVHFSDVSFHQCPYGVISSFRNQSASVFTFYVLISIILTYEKLFFNNFSEISLVKDFKHFGIAPLNLRKIKLHSFLAEVSSVFPKNPVDEFLKHPLPYYGEQLWEPQGLCKLKRDSKSLGERRSLNRKHKKGMSH